MNRVEVYEMFLVFIMVGSSIALLFAKSRITAVFLNGVLGYSVAFFFIVFRAPDLALTQLVVESVSTVLYLIAFRHLPEIKKENSPKYIKMRNAIISIATGAYGYGYWTCCNELRKVHSNFDVL